MTVDGHTRCNGRGGFTDAVNSLNHGQANELRANGLWTRVSPGVELRYPVADRASRLVST